MKKIMTMVMLAVATTAMYANEEKNANVVDDMKPNYEMNIHAGSIARFLFLAEDQKFDVEEIHNSLMDDMRKAANTADAKKARRIARRAISYDLLQMSNVLSEWQYSRYKAAIYATLRNRGIDY